MVTFLLYKLLNLVTVLIDLSTKYLLEWNYIWWAHKRTKILRAKFILINAWKKLTSLLSQPNKSKTTHANWIKSRYSTENTCSSHWVS